MHSKTCLVCKKYLQYLQIKYTYAGWNEPSEMAMEPYYTFIIPSIIVYILVGLFIGVMVDRWIGSSPRRAAPAAKSATNPELADGPAPNNVVMAEAVVDDVKESP